METTEESVIGMIQSGEDARKPREWGMMPNGMAQENRGYENGGYDMPRQKGYRGNGKDRGGNAGQRNRNHMRSNNRGGQGGYGDGMDINGNPRQRGNNRGNHANPRYNGQGGNQKPYYGRNYKTSEFGEGRRDGMMGQRQHDPMSPPRDYYREEN